MRHPARQHAPPRQAREVHARHVAKPTQLATRHVEVGRVEAEPAHKLLRRYVQRPHVRACDAAHAPQAARVQRAQLLQQHLGDEGHQLSLPYSMIASTTPSYAAAF